MDKILGADRKADVAEAERPRDIQNPYVFIVGCPRSGTTLLQRMLDNHPQLAVANDSHFITEAIDGLDVGFDPVLTPSMVQSVRSYYCIGRLGVPDRAFDQAALNARTYSEFVSHLFSELAKFHGKPLAGEKVCRYIWHLQRLSGLFPRTRFVHIIRDGRDVALSALDWARDDKGPGRHALWRDEPVAVCALWWIMLVEIGRRQAADLGASRYCEVLYEDLVARPEEELRRIAEFLHIPYAPQMLTFHAGKTRRDPRLSSKKRWLPPTAGLRDWRSDMAKRDVELFEALAGDLLSDLGYEKGATVISDEIAEVAERCRTWWQGKMARRASRKRHAALAELYGDA